MNANFVKHFHIQNIHEGNLDSKPFLKCTQCSYQNKNERNLKQHVYKQHSLRKTIPHKCKSCSYETKYASHLKIHIKRIHLGITLECNMCDKTFKNEKSLKFHIKSEHLKERYPCTSCPYEGTSKRKVTISYSNISNLR